MKPDKNILDHKKSSRKKASKAYFDQTKSEIWRQIDDNETTPVHPIQSRSTWIISGLSAAAVIALIFTVMNFNHSSNDIIAPSAALQKPADTLENQENTAGDIPDDYYANNYELETIEEIYYENNKESVSIVDTTSAYEDYLIEQNIDESIILEELL